MQLIKYIIIFLPIILFLISLIIGLLTVGYKESKDFISVAPFILILTLFYNLFMFIVLLRPTTEVVSQTTVEYKLVSTKFSNTIDGSFFLGAGVVDNEEYMCYVIRDNNELRRENTQNYKIYITDKEPYVEVERKVIKESITNWLYNINDIEEKVIEDESQCVFYIPEDSILQNINID